MSANAGPTAPASASADHAPETAPIPLTAPFRDPHGNPGGAGGERTVLLITHTGRSEARDAARKVSHGWSFGISDLEGGTEGLSMILRGLA